MMKIKYAWKNNILKKCNSDVIWNIVYTMLPFTSHSFVVGFTTRAVDL